MGVGLLGELYSVWVGGAEGTDALYILIKIGQLHSLILMIITYFHAGAGFASANSSS